MAAISRVCGSCHKELSPPQAKTCNGCKFVFYCGKTCQRAAWPTHKLVCKAPLDQSVAQKTQKVAADSKLTPSASAQEVVAYECDGDGITADDQQAFFLLLKAAEQGDPRAQREVAYTYYMGEGIPVDKQRAFFWLLKAAEQGDPRAQARVVDLYYFKGEKVPVKAEHAVSWLLKDAEQGNPNAQLRIAHLYYNGDGVSRDERQAFAWLLKAAEQGHFGAQSQLGETYYSGNWTSQDLELAFYWLSKAASRGELRALQVLGDMYRDGVGVPQDLPTAIEYYRRCGTADVEHYGITGKQLAIYSLGLLGFYDRGVWQHVYDLPKPGDW